MADPFIPTSTKTASPYIKVSITGSDGVKPDAEVMKPVIINIPAGLSLRVSMMHVMEIVMRQLKRGGLKDALKAIGLR